MSWQEIRIKREIPRPSQEETFEKIIELEDLIDRSFGEAVDQYNSTRPDREVSPSFADFKEESGRMHFWRRDDITRTIFSEITFGINSSQRTSVTGLEIRGGAQTDIVDSEGQRVFQRFGGPDGLQFAVFSPSVDTQILQETYVNAIALLDNVESPFNHAA